MPAALAPSWKAIEPATSKAGPDESTSWKLPSYSFTWQEGCFCGSDQIRPIRISVTGDTITRATFDDDHTPVTDAVMTNLKTIPGVFDMIQGAITAHYHSLQVTYDPDVEYPIEVFIDPSDASDDGMQLTLSSFASPADPS